MSDVFMKNKKKRSRRFDLEKEYGFRLMIHQRDWIAGRTIRANIMDGIEKSRRVIFVLSRYVRVLRNYKVGKVESHKNANFTGKHQIQTPDPKISSHLNHVFYVNIVLSQGVSLMPSLRLKGKLFEHDDIYTAHQRSCGKVMVSRVSACHSVPLLVISTIHLFKPVHLGTTPE